MIYMRNVIKIMYIREKIFMTGEIIFKNSKPDNTEEILHFRQFKLELKNLLKEGKSKTRVVEKFKDFTFTVSDYSSGEKQKIAVFLKETKIVGVL